MELERAQQSKSRDQDLKRERETLKDEMERNVTAAKDEFTREQERSKQMQEVLSSLKRVCCTYCSEVSAVVTAVVLGAGGATPGSKTSEQREAGRYKQSEGNGKSISTSGP